MSSLLDPAQYPRFIEGIEYKNMSVLLADFRRYFEHEAGGPIETLDLNGALWLYDLCNFLGLGDEQRKRVLGKTALAHVESFIETRVSMVQSDAKRDSSRLRA
jgi:hypothetical protein